MPAFDVTTPDWIIDHKLGTRDLIVQASQNGFQVLPDVHFVNEDQLRICALGVSETNPLRVIVLPVESQESKSSGTKKTSTKSSGTKQRSKNS